MLFRTTAIAISVFMTLLLLLTDSADDDTLATNTYMLVFAIPRRHRPHLDRFRLHGTQDGERYGFGC